VLNNKNKRVAIIDYNMGNMFSVQHACNHVGLDSVITSNKNEILASDAAILPGVGAFKEAMVNLKGLDLIVPIKEYISSGKPFLGICLGMQLLFSESEEFGSNKGLGVIPGRVIRFDGDRKTDKPIKVPHMGWNQIKQSNGMSCWLLKRIPDGAWMYFVHSYYVAPEDKGCIMTTTDYGVEFTSMVRKDNICATQFHPEKSAKVGIQIYNTWAESLLNQ